MEDRDMVKAICVSKNRNDKGVIVNYTLKDANGQVRNFTGKEIKDGIRNKKLEVMNLQIDKAGRLVNKAAEKQHTVKRQTLQKDTKEKLEGAEAELSFLLTNTTGVQCIFGKRDIKETFKFDNENDKNRFAYIIKKYGEVLNRIKFYDVVKEALTDGECVGMNYFYVKHVNHKAGKEDMMYYAGYNNDEVDSGCLTSEQAIKRADAVYEKYLETFI